ncbi:MAG: AraC family transcriptional regulator [Alphaproteobacteria bacterium]|nr:AraC family transcriptional regulator [Alphaproteobacteria bacterium]
MTDIEHAERRSDPLASVIALLRPRAVLSKVITGAGDWSVRYEAHDDPGFCLMLEGSCLLQVDGMDPLALGAHDFVLLPTVPGFTMASDLDVRPRPGTPGASDLRHGSADGPAGMRQLGGYFEVDRANASLVVGLLPRLVHVRNGAPGSTRIRRLVELIADEALDDRAGRELVLGRLVEVLLVEALRVDPPPGEGRERGLLAGLRDPGLARALQRIHAEVAQSWTVESLARCAGMSRATFAERFSKTVGLAPMAYVSEWRMALARDALREDVALAEVAAQVGYGSASAFSTAFSRLVGCSPSQYSRRVRVGVMGH